MTKRPREETAEANSAGPSMWRQDLPRVCPGCVSGHVTHSLSCPRKRKTDYTSTGPADPNCKGCKPESKRVHTCLRTLHARVSKHVMTRGRPLASIEEQACANFFLVAIEMLEPDQQETFSIMHKKILTDKASPTKETYTALAKLMLSVKID